MHFGAGSDLSAITYVYPGRMTAFRVEYKCRVLCIIYQASTRIRRGSQPPRNPWHTHTEIPSEPHLLQHARSEVR